MQGAFINEVRINKGGLELTSPLILCTPAYLLERDRQELEWARRCELLRLENEQLRLK